MGLRQQRTYWQVGRAGGGGHDGGFQILLSEAEAHSQAGTQLVRPSHCPVDT